MTHDIDELAQEIAKTCKTQEDFTEFFKQLKRRGLEAALSGELTHHLGYDKHAKADARKSNSRNGYSKKTIQVNEGEMEIAVPRDRTGTFEPQIIPKYATRFDGLDEKIISFYARGLSTRDIQSELEEIYGTTISPTLISSVTDAVLSDVRVLSQKVGDRSKICDFAKECIEMISFKWRHFRQDIILMLVRWYVAYSLSYRDIEELALERGLKVDHSTINRWVIEYSPQLEEEFRKRYKRPVGISWRMDEIYIKGVYLYRAVDKEGKTVDFMLSEKRDEPAARAFFQKAIGSNGVPDRVTMDKSGANKAGINTINLQLALLFMMGGLFIQLTVRQIKYLNNIVEQDHRFIKKITKPMKGFKAFLAAEATLKGIELHHMLRKKQHNQSDNQTIFEQFYGLAA